MALSQVMKFLVFLVRTGDPVFWYIMGIEWLWKHGAYLNTNEWINAGCEGDSGIQ